MPSRRVAVVTALALLVSFAPAFATVCIGWDSSAHARMACCAKADHDGSSAAADECCKAGERRAHGQLTPGLAGAVLTDLRAVGTVAPPPPIGGRSAHVGRQQRRAPDLATYLLLSVFLL